MEGDGIITEVTGMINAVRWSNVTIYAPSGKMLSR